MNSHNQPDDLTDLGLRHSLKNWAARKDPPVDGRERLLAAAQEEVSVHERKPSKFKFGWSFRFLVPQEVAGVRPIYGYTIESLYSLKANMAII